MHSHSATRWLQKYHPTRLSSPHLTLPHRTNNNKHNDAINLHAQTYCTHKLHNQTHPKISQNVYKSKRNLVANDVQVSHTEFTIIIADQLMVVSKLVVISCNMSLVSTNRLRSSAKSRSARREETFHLIPMFGLFMALRSMKSITRQNKNGESMHFGRTPVILSNIQWNRYLSSHNNGSSNTTF